LTPKILSRSPHILTYPADIHKHTHTQRERDRQTDRQTDRPDDLV